MTFILRHVSCRGFPGGPVVRTWHFHSRSPGSIPGRELKSPSPMAQPKKKKKTCKL